MHALMKRNISIPDIPIYYEAKLGNLNNLFFLIIFLGKTLASNNILFVVWSCQVNFNSYLADQSYAR